MDALVPVLATGLSLLAGVSMGRLILDGVLRLTFGRSRS